MKSLPKVMHFQLREVGDLDFSGIVFYTTLLPVDPR
jgi:hypothetical protein